MRKTLFRKMTLAMTVATVFALVLSSVAFADGTVTDDPASPSNPKTSSSNGTTTKNFGTANATYGSSVDEDVSITAASPALSPAAPSGYSYASTSITVGRTDGFVGTGGFIVMCFAVPAGSSAQIMRLNQFGNWEAAPTVSYPGGVPPLVCTMSNLVGTFAAFVAD